MLKLDEHGNPHQQYSINPVIHPIYNQEQFLKYRENTGLYV